MKTGYTVNAGYCLTATAKKNNLRLVSVVMGEESIENRSQDTVKLLNYGFNTYKMNVLKEKNKILGTYKVEKGKVDETKIVLKNDLSHLINSSEEKIDYKYEIKLNKIIAPIKKGEIVGKVNVYDDKHTLLLSGDLTVPNTILKANLWDYIKKNIKIVLSFS